jgi:hypothetical protein
MRDAASSARLPAGLLAVALAGCGALPVSLSEGTQSFSSKDYERVFESWTREAQAYNLDTFDNSLTVSATFRSWQFRQAYVDRYVDDFRLDEGQRSELLGEQRLAFDGANEFLVAATATKPKWADFTREDSPWSIALVTDRGVEVAPAEIEKVNKPSPALEAYYPFINVYRKTFVLRFPKTLPDGAAVLAEDLGSFSLVFAGALGRAELEWKVKPPTGSSR